MYCPRRTEEIVVIIIAPCFSGEVSLLSLSGTGYSSTSVVVLVTDKGPDHIGTQYDWVLMASYEKSLAFELDFRRKGEAPAMGVSSFS